MPLLQMWNLLVDEVVANMFFLWYQIDSAFSEFFEIFCR
ncbi:Uncharacterised protein [Vibrio cholerae]|nr:Uncharacterised protein [Vibrio cholerae]